MYAAREPVSYVRRAIVVLINPDLPAETPVGKEVLKLSTVQAFKLRSLVA
jgi:hypothetical protein